ncbi:MAG: ATP-binding protein [Bacteroidota bacterium]|nr:ATP-binding protein [Bacteroidota bacterium]
MIEIFNIENFASFRDMQTLSLTAEKLRSNYSSLDTDNLVVFDKNDQILKSKVIYGANASGKSNVVKALQCFVNVVCDENLDLIQAFKFSSETINKPSTFEVVLKVDKIKYRFGFTASKDKIFKEWLYFTPHKREQFLYERQDNEIVDYNKVFFTEAEDYANRKNANIDDKILILTQLSYHNQSRIAEDIVETIKKMVFVYHKDMEQWFVEAKNKIQDIDIKRFVLQLLNKSGSQIEDIYIDNNFQLNFNDVVNKNGVVMARHNFFDEVNGKIGAANWEFYTNQSDGERLIFAIAPILYDAIIGDKIVIFDSLDVFLHPLYMQNIIRLFNSKKNKKAQIITTTYNTLFLHLNIMRRDQIDFIDKNYRSESKITTLYRIKGVRANHPFHQDYIDGNYGCVPPETDFFDVEIEY